MNQLTISDVQEGQDLPELSIDVTPTTVVLGALATRDWRPMHHDKDFAQNRNGTRHIFINTPHNAAYFERYITDWTGPRGRLGKIQFRMSDSVFPGDTMVFHYDFGDDWRFKVTLESVDEIDAGKTKALKVIKKSGTAPKQYDHGDW